MESSRGGGGHYILVMAFTAERGELDKMDPKDSAEARAGPRTMLC